MKFNFVAPVLVTAFALAAAIPFVGKVQAQEGETVSFTCGKYRGSPATFFDGQPTPLITWRTRAFGANWNPSQRCLTVTDKLNALVSEPGLDNVLFTNGRVNGEQVICWISEENERCNGNNVLFTLGRRVDAVAVLETFENRLGGLASAGSIANNVDPNEPSPRKVVRLRDILRR